MTTTPNPATFLGLKQARLVCPCCGQTFPFESFEWLDELQTLAFRHEGLGIKSGLENLSMLEAWGVYQWLSRWETR